ncbi:mandelate racemase/muconate lactonizing enzyme family protein [Ramlibacter sp. G-1-2-2]|uniref:Mandelate racemase/muconate lactonizing enzyme family protein n=1 Tax=Ramlibacter agri TaxID=2728837 RepID=A0A848H5W4_9BURK|nr:mandelate racemase/muconate lactonizing enzyme family protein [Ramlibacter agri]NML46185.1 mandelate racemase/muconate lactonizing enzyme family protein [Ramlibacter agri]
MKITALEQRTLSVPTGTAVSASIGSFDAVSYLVLTLHTDSGLAGSSHIQVPGRFGVQALRALVDDFAGLVVGRDPCDTAGFAELSWKRAFWLGQSGLWAFATSALDVAMWDIAGQAAGQPLWRLWGGKRDGVDVYGSGRMWLAQPLDSIVAEARDFVAQGFRAIKMRVASPELQRDVQRVAAVREAIGPGVRLMVDCNQGLDLERAVQLAAALRPYDIAWIEEPLPFHDVAGHAELRRRIDIPIATGENLYLPQEFEAFLAQGAVDVLMPDLQRCGGYTGMNRIAQACAAAGVRFSPHAYAWHSTHSVAACSGGGLVEYMPRGDQMFGRRSVLHDGLLQVPQEAGTGLRYDPPWLEQYRDA